MDDIKNVELFPSLVGQRKAREKLSLLVELQRDTGIIPPILVTGQRGGGKNSLANALSKCLCPLNSKDHKQILEINCASIESESQFFDEIVDNYLVDKDITIILDECHALHKSKLIDTFLSILNVKDSYVTTYIHGGQNYSFDLAKISWIFLTSEPNLIPDTLISRFEVIQLEDLSISDLAKIVNNGLKGIRADDKLLEDIASVGRNNGRECYKLGEVLYRYCNAKKKDSISNEDWATIKSQLGLRSMGINNIEYRILSFLNKNGTASLTKLSSALQLTSSATRGAFERYLLANNLIEIQAVTGRGITKHGKEYLEKNVE